MTVTLSWTCSELTKGAGGAYDVFRCSTTDGGSRFIDGSWDGSLFLLGPEGNPDAIDLDGSIYRGQCPWYSGRTRIEAPIEDGMAVFSGSRVTNESRPP